MKIDYTSNCHSQCTVRSTHTYSIPYALTVRLMPEMWQTIEWDWFKEGRTKWVPEWNCTTETIRLGKVGIGHWRDNSIELNACEYQTSTNREQRHFSFSVLSTNLHYGCWVPFSSALLRWKNVHSLLLIWFMYVHSQCVSFGVWCKIQEKGYSFRIDSSLGAVLALADYHFLDVW